jgi:hypothetical protein
MTPHLQNFRCWLASELKKEYDLSGSADFLIRKKANLRIDELKLVLQILDEFLLEHPSP